MSDLMFADEEPGEWEGPQAEPEGSAWAVLVVDDDPEVHAVTRLILNGLRFRDRPLSLLSAHSAAEARALLEEGVDPAVILLDVVMETEHAGLDLVRHIREDRDDHAVRIIVRTGQPGRAPEDRVVREHEINDYRVKTDLTSRKLTTALLAGLRDYAHIRELEAARAERDALAARLRACGCEGASGADGERLS